MGTVEQAATPEGPDISYLPVSQNLGLERMHGTQLEQTNQQILTPE